MAGKAQMTIRVYSSRSATRVQFSTSGKYVSFTTAGLTGDLTQQPLLTTASLVAFWLQVLAIVQGEISP